MYYVCHLFLLVARFFFQSTTCAAWNWAEELEFTVSGASEWAEMKSFAVLVGFVESLR